MQIAWEDPPPAYRFTRPAYQPGERGKWNRFADELRRHPGRWALVTRNAFPNRLAMLQRRLKQVGCEAVMRYDDAGTAALYARWPE